MIRLKMSRIVSTTAVVALLLLSTACSRTAPASGPGGRSTEPIKIGMLVELTGTLSWQGQETLDGAQLFADELNAKGGINGRPVVLIVYNTESSPDKAMNGVRKLVHQDKVVALIGAALATEARAVSPLLKDGPPLIAISGAYAPEHRMIFGSGLFLPDMQRQALRFLGEQNLKRVGALHATDAGGQALEQALVADAPKGGVDIVRLEHMNNTDVDATAQLTKIKAAQPDALTCFMVGKPMSVVLKGMKQLGMSIPMVMSYGNITPEFLATSSELQIGPINFLGPKFLIWKEIDDNDPQKPMITNLQTAHMAKVKREAGIAVGQGYDALLILSESIRRSGSTEPTEIVKGIEGIQGLAGVWGIYNFSQTDHRGLDSSFGVPMMLEQGKIRGVR